MAEIKLNIDAKQSAKTLQGLETQLDEMKTKLKGLEVGSTAFKNLQKEVISLDSKVKNINKSIEGMDFEGVASEIGKFAGGVGSAFAGLQAATMGAGAGLEEFVQKVGTAIAIGQGIKGGIEAWTAAQKLLNITTGVGTVVTTASATASSVDATAKGAEAVATEGATVAQWNLNAAMTANPIGAVIVAVVALVSALGVLTDGFGLFTDEVTIGDEILESIKENLIKEQAELIKLETELNKTNIAQKDRNKLINDLNTSYGPYMSNLLTEKSTNEDIATAMKEINKQMMLKLAFVAVEDKLKEVYKKQAELRFQIADGTLKNNKLNKLALEGYDKQVETLMKYKDGIASLQIKKDDDIKKTDEQILKEKELEEKRKKAHEAWLKKQEDKKAKSEQLQKDLDVALEEADNAVETSIENQIKAEEDYYKSLDELKEQNYVNSISADEQELAAVDAKYEALYEKAILANEDMTELQRLHGEELQKLSDEQTAKKLAAEKEASDKEIEIAKAKLQKQRLDEITSLSNKFEAIASMASAFNNFANDMGIKNEGLRKTLALAEIGTNAAASIANAVRGGTAAGASTGVAAPITTPIFVAELVGIALSSVAGAYKVLKKTPETKPTQFKPPKFADGGYVSGPGSSKSDSIVARLSAGEYVVNAASTNAYRPLLENINKGASVLSDIDMDLLAMKIGQGISNIPVINVATETENVSRKVKNIQSRRSIG